MNSENKIYYISKKFKKVVLAFALTGTLGISSVSAVTTVENDIVTEEDTIEQPIYMAKSTSTSSKKTNVKKKKWKKLDNKLEYRVLDDGTTITREHKYKKVKYNKKTKRDVVECVHCGAKTTEKHSHNIESWKKNKTTKKYVGKCTECHKTVKKNKLTKEEKKLLETSTKSYSSGGGGGGGSSSSSKSYSTSSSSSTTSSSSSSSSNNSTSNTTPSKPSTPTTPVHTHTFSGDWIKLDDVYHYRECDARDGETEEKKHEYGDVYVDGNGNFKIDCDECGYQKNLSDIPSVAKMRVEALESSGCSVGDTSVIDDALNLTGMNIDYLKDLKASLLCFFKNEEIEENKTLTYKI